MNKDLAYCDLSRFDGLYVGNYGNIGYNAIIPSHTKIGNNVMMGENCSMFSVYHKRMENGKYKWR